jgi:hypothetical protein
MTPINQLFKIRYGSHGYDNKSVLDEGGTLLIASQGVDNGAFGFFDVPQKYQEPVISVPRTGSIGFAFVQMTPCNITDDCMVLIPLEKFPVEYLFYVASVIRFSKWRYNYGRKITPKRLETLDIIHPDEFKANVSYEALFKQLYPKPRKIEQGKQRVATTKKINVTQLFDLERGHFHALDKLEKGKYLTISRVSDNNGVVGFYEKPKKAKVFPASTMTISTVTGDAFIQYEPFIATDNVVMCIPKEPLRETTLIYIQVLLNKSKWRYSYGRQCYKGSFEKTLIDLPVINGDKLDEDYMEAVVTSQPYWSEFKERILLRSRSLSKTVA